MTEKDPWASASIGKDFFGEDWILPRIFWKALAADRIGALVEPLKRLLTAPFTLRLAAILVPQAVRRVQSR